MQHLGSFYNPIFELTPSTDTNFGDIKKECFECKLICLVRRASILSRCLQDGGVGFPDCVFCARCWLALDFLSNLMWWVRCWWRGLMARMMDRDDDMPTMVIGMATVEAVTRSHVSIFRMLSSCHFEQSCSRLVFRVDIASICCSWTTEAQEDSQI